ncbi:MAG TPA: hypothetical protein C5S51_03775 [Methanosarcinaceae archaeon]|nr:hypothetical protein [Methanosarcinaceae archaeon]
MVDYETIAIVLHIYTWIVAAVIVTFIGGIGLFYQKKFNVNTQYYLFLIPLLVLLIAITPTHLFLYNRSLIEASEALGGLMSLILTAKLYFHMTGGE